LQPNGDAPEVRREAIQEEWILAYGPVPEVRSDSSNEEGRVKKYALYPGVGRVSPGGKLGYIGGRQLAACYRVPYSECLDTDIAAIKKVMSMGKAPIYLLNLVPQESGHYKVPNANENRIILAEGLHQSVRKDG
jgi:hypothetical protein